MFAGMLGTTHLVTHTLERIRARPDVYVAAWKKNTRSFLLESARVDPPVTSVTAVLGEGKLWKHFVLRPSSLAHTLTQFFTTVLFFSCSFFSFVPLVPFFLLLLLLLLLFFPPSDQVLDIGIGKGQGTGFKRLKLLKGTTMQLTLSTANRDPHVFGGRANSKVVANSFNPNRPQEELNKILSWNGVHEQVMTGEAPRGCIGYHVSFDVATKIITKFLPAVGMETQETAERKAAHDQVTNVENDGNSVFSLKFSSLNTEVVYGVSVLTYVVFIYYMKIHFANRETKSSLTNKIRDCLSIIVGSGNAEYGVMSEQVRVVCF
jgi:energy-coupling factor transporter transmembrane protein EcfT